MQFDIKVTGTNSSHVAKRGVENWSDADIEAISNPKVRRSLARGSKLISQQKWDKALPHLLKAWDALPNNVDVLSSLAFALTKLGVRDKAIDVLQRALRYSEPTIDLLKVVGVLAYSMEFYDIAEKVNRILLSMDPNDQNTHIDLISCLIYGDKIDDAISYAQAVIPLFPENGELWAALGNAVFFRDGAKSSYVFFEEALKHAPDNFKIHNNFAGALHVPERKKEHFERAIELEPSNAEPHLGLSFSLFLLGDLENAYPHYYWRLHESRAIEQRIIWSHNFTEWQGEDLSGKTIFVTNEQGLGDEVFFMQFLGRLLNMADHVIVACDKRLTSMIARTYPTVRTTTAKEVVTQGYKYRIYQEIEKEAESGDLTVDYFVHMGELMRHFWPNRAAVEPIDGYIEPEPELKAKWSDRFAELGPRPKVGIAWTSLKKGGSRKQQYLDLEMLKPILTVEGVDFICVQYGDKGAEIAEFKEKYGVEIHTWDDFDIKDDLEDNVALMSLCDAVVGPANAALHFAAFAKGGQPWWMLHDRPWWSFGDGDVIPWNSNYRLFNNNFEDTWTETVNKVRDALVDMRDGWSGPKN